MSKIGSDTTWAKSRARSVLDAVPNSRTLRMGRARSQACLPGHGRKIGNEKRPARNQPRFEAEWRWVCRMPSVTERLVVSSPSVCEVWAHRLLRQFSEPACVQACGENGASDHCQLRARRGLVLRLREAGDDQGCGVASATFASGGSTITWTGRESSSELGITAALAGVDRFFMNGSGTRVTVFVMSTVSKGASNERRTKGAINERGTSRPEEL